MEFLLQANKRSARLITALKTIDRMNNPRADIHVQSADYIYVSSLSFNLLWVWLVVIVMVMVMSCMYMFYNIEAFYCEES